MVRRAQMQKQMDISSTKADKLLKKAKKMNNQMFNEGGVKMTKKGEDPLEGFEFTGETDNKGNLQIKNKKTGKTSILLPGGDSVYPSGKEIERNMGGTAQMKAIPEENKGLPKLPKEVRNKMGYMKDGGTAQNNNAKKSRGAGAMIKGTTFRGVY